MKRASNLSVFVWLAFCLFPDSVEIVRADWQVWTVQGSRHVLRSQLPENRREARLAAARNEWESFQVLMRSDTPIREVRLEPAPLRGPGGAVLPVSEARLFREHQLHLETGTYRNADFKADWYPDPLIPFVNPITGQKLEGGRIQAIPFDLAAEETHAFWVDLHMPEGTPAGEYRGVYRLTGADHGAVEVPVSLNVWDFALPRVPTFQTSFGSPAERMRSYYRQRAKTGKDAEPKDWASIDAQCAQLLSEHRLDATPPPRNLQPVAQADGTFLIPSEQVRALREFVDRFAVNALEIPHPSSVIKDPEAEREKLQAWLRAFDHAAADLGRPGVIFYTYLRDEPNSLEDYRYVQKWGHAIREAKSVVKVLVVEQTWTAPGQNGADSAWGDLYGAVDIWCPLFSLHRQESAARRQALGEIIWTYTALCQGEPTPWWHIDFPLLNYRVPAWMAWRDGMRGLLYWGGMAYWNQVEDPWLQAPVYTGSGTFQQGDKGIVFQGEGSLVYPARAVGYDGIVPTVRLKALRDGIEDYEYLAILERLGKRAEADEIVRPLVQSFFKWDHDPSAYQAARARLAELIAGQPAKGAGR
jgi:heme exporter protein D